MINDKLAVESKLPDAFKTCILVIDDDDAIRRYLRIVLQAENFAIYEATTAQAGLAWMTDYQPDIVLLDLQQPIDDVINLIDAIHRISYIPILMLSIQDNAERKIEVLDAGAEDYIVKPFSTGELLARIRVALRRVRMVEHVDIFISHNLEVDFVRRTVRVNAEMIDLTLTEYKLLRFLIVHADQSVTHQQLWQAVSNDSDVFKAHTLRVHLSNLRRKLEADSNNPRYILTEVGVGYRFQTEKSYSRI